MAAADMGDSLDAYDGDPAVMNTIKRALQSERLAPQWTEPDSPPPPPQQLQQLPPLREDELEELAARPEPALPFTERDRELLSRSISSLDYLGDWADPKKVVDSAVLMCTWPQLIQHPRAAPEFTCSYDDFQSERHQLHAHIIERMLKSAAKNGFDGRASLSSLAHSERINAIASASYSRPGRSATAPLAAPTGGPPAFPALSPGQQHVFIVVGVPGSGKDTVLKRFLQTLGLPLLDASADLVKEYLAAWGQDELSQEVRKNNAEHGPGKHLLHAQYLHRESILVIDRVVERALEQRKLLMLEKTLFNLEPVLECARTPDRRAAKPRAGRTVPARSRVAPAPKPSPCLPTHALTAPVLLPGTPPPSESAACGCTCWARTSSPCATGSSSPTAWHRASPSAVSSPRIRRSSACAGTTPTYSASSRSRISGARPHMPRAHARARAHPHSPPTRMRRSPDTRVCACPAQVRLRLHPRVRRHRQPLVRLARRGGGRRGRVSAR